MKSSADDLSNSTIVMFGPSLQSRGGMTEVINVYRRSGLFDRWNVSYVPTLEGKHPWSKVKAVFVAFLRYAMLLGKRKVGLVHVHSASRWSFVRKSLFVLPALALNKPVVFQLHGGEFINVYGELGVVAKAYVRFIVERSSRVVVLSAKWKEMLHGIAPGAEITVIMNPIEPAATSETKTERSPSMLLFLGRLEWQKGLFVLLDAVSRVDKRQALRLMLGGEGDVLSVRQRIQELGIVDKVELLGWVDGARKSVLVDTAAVLVLPSFAEGLPMSMLEAMSHGTPVITTPVGGIPDVLDDGVDGILVPPGDPDKLATAIEYLLKNPGIARRMGEAGRRKCEARFSSNVIIPEVEALYRQFGMRSCDDFGGISPGDRAPFGGP